MNMHGVHQMLQRYFGHTQFRDGQAEIIGTVLQGRNVLGLLPTGGGKSITYQLLALALPALTVVVSPLISLMVDQVQQLRRNGHKWAVYLNSTVSMEEARQTLQMLKGKHPYKLLYISPEKLQQPHVQQALKERGVSLLAIDEAHCISQWGHDFRTDYLRLPQIAAALGAPPVLAVTATATPAVREEICNLFSIERQDVVSQSMNRPNIAYELIPVSSEAEKQELLIEQISHLRGPGIVYCATRQAVEAIVHECRLAKAARVHGYHGGMLPLERMLVQEQFLRGELDVIVATNAFGMGIDKKDIRFVLHYHFPASIEAYVQEVGRVGRDGENGYAGLFYLPEDVFIHQHIVKHEYPNREEITRLLGWITQYRMTSITHAQIADELGIGEQMAQLILFYAERMGILSELSHTKSGFQFRLVQAATADTGVQIGIFIEKIKRKKLSKLQHMLSWIETGECLRKGLLAYFGEGSSATEPSRSTGACCSVCGVQRTDYQHRQTVISEREQETWNLEQALRNLLPPCQRVGGES